MADDSQIDIYFRCIIPTDDGYYTRGPWWRLKEEDENEVPWRPAQKRWIHFVGESCLGIAGEELIKKAAGHWTPEEVRGIDVRPDAISWGDEHDEFSREHVLGGWADRDDKESGEIPFRELVFTTNSGGQDTSEDEDGAVCELDDDDDGGLCGIPPGRVFTWMVRRDKRDRWWDQLRARYVLLLGVRDPTKIQLRAFAAALGLSFRIQYDLHGCDQVAKQLRF